jgi:hypothetical protein
MTFYFFDDYLFSKFVLMTRRPAFGYTPATFFIGILLPVRGKFSRGTFVYCDKGRKTKRWGFVADDND